MQIRDALITRKSVRAFLPRPVEREKLDAVFEYARYAPSGVNMQPWEVAIVSGESKHKLDEALQQAFENGITPSMEYRYYPQTWIEPFKSRRKETGLMMYEALGIAREDRDKQREQWKANYRAFDAPTVLLFFIPKGLENGSFLDYGMFLQSVMLMATEQGLSTCPQAALAEYPDVVRKVLNIPEEKMVIAGMAIGYEDPDAPVNRYRTPRLDKESFTTYYL